MNSRSFRADALLLLAAVVLALQDPDERANPPVLVGQQRDETPFGSR